MPLAGPVQKFKVVIAFHKEEGVDYDPIWADSREQAEEIALDMFRDSRRDFEELRDVRACGMNPTKKQFLSDDSR
jgi:hypothetical protein